MICQRTLRTLAITAAIASISFAAANSQDSAPATASTGAEESEGSSDQDFRLREGMKFVDRIGELNESGGRISFRQDGQSQSLLLLENLALERVSDDLDQTGRKWSVSGIVTEFKGSNYLLLQRAVLKARSTKASGSRS